MSSRFGPRLVLVSLMALAVWLAPNAVRGQCKGGKQSGSATTQSMPGMAQMQAMQMMQRAMQARQTGGLSASPTRNLNGINQGAMNQRGLQAQQPGMGFVVQPAMPVLTGTPQAILQTAAEQQRQLSGLLLMLQELQDAGGLSEARQRKLTSAVTTAAKKIDQQEEQLTGFFDLTPAQWTATKRRALARMIEQQQAIFGAMEAYRVAADDAQAARKLKTVQP